MSAPTLQESIAASVASHGFPDGERERYLDACVELERWEPELRFLHGASFAYARDAMNGDRRKVVPLPAFSHSTRAEHIYIGIRDDPRTPSERKLDVANRAAILLHDVPESAVEQKERRFLATLGAEEIDRTTLTGMRARWRRRALDRWWEDARAAARDYAHVTSGVREEALYDLVADVGMAVDKLTRERRSIEYERAPDGSVVATYPRHVLSLVERTKFKGRRSCPDDIARTLAVKAVERGQGMDDLFPVPHGSFSDEINRFASQLDWESLRRRRCELEREANIATAAYDALSERFSQEHKAARHAFERDGLSLFTGVHRFTNYAKNMLVLNVASRWLASSTAERAHPWQVGAARGAVLFLAARTREAVLREQDHLVVYHQIHPRFAQSTRAEVGEYFRLPESWRFTKHEREGDLPGFLRKYNAFTSRYVAMLSRRGERQKAQLFADYEQQLRDAVVLEHIFSRFAENEHRPVGEWEFIRGDVL